MAITSSGQVSFSDLNTELGRSSTSHCSLGEGDTGALLGSRGIVNYWNDHNPSLPVTSYGIYQPNFDKDRHIGYGANWGTNNENNKYEWANTRIYARDKQVRMSDLYNNYLPYSKVWSTPNNFYSPTSKALNPLFVFDAATEGAYRGGNNPAVNTLQTSSYYWGESNTLLASMYRKAGADETPLWSGGDHIASSDHWRPNDNYASYDNTTSAYYNNFDYRNAGRGQWMTTNTSNPYPRSELKSYTRPYSSGTTYCLRMRGTPYFNPFWRRHTIWQSTSQNTSGSNIDIGGTQPYQAAVSPANVNGSGDPAQEITNTGGWTCAIAYRMLSGRGTTGTWTRPFQLWGSGISEYANIGWYIYNPNGYNVWYCGSMYSNSQYVNQYGYNNWPSGVGSYGSLQDIWWIRVFSFSGSYQRASSSSSGGGSVTGNVSELIKTSAGGSFTSLSNFVSLRNQTYNGTAGNAKISYGSNSSYRWSPQWGPSYWNYWSGISNECYDLMHLSFYTHPLSSTRKTELVQNLATEYLGGGY